MKSLFLYCLCFNFLLVSCGGQNLQKQLEEFTRKEVTIPDEIRQMVGGQDSILLNLASGSAKFVMWVDSMACSTCRLNQMPQYGEIIDFREESGENFIPVFVFSPPFLKIDEVVKVIQLTQFDYPVFIDDKGLFPAANPHIPADNRFHTFLLDRDGKVVLVGDPVNNPQLWELYKTTITQLIENGGTMPDMEKQD